MRQYQTEVLVVGAGPVGMYTALRLAEAGIRTQIIDRESRTAGHSYACALHPHTLKLLDEAGIADEVIKHGRRLNKIGFYCGGARRSELRLSELPAEFPFVLVVDQGRLEDLLEQRLWRLGNVSVDWNHRLADLETNDRGVTATLEKLAPTGKGYGVPDFGLCVAKIMQTRADFLVGADGHNSLVRQRLGVNYEEAGERELFEVYEVETKGGFDDEMKVVFDRGTTSVMWPFADNKCRWSFQMPQVYMPEEFPGKERARLVIGEAPGEDDGLHHVQRLLRERAPWFQSEIREVGWATEIQFEHRLVNHFGRGRCWLAGDAAHQTGPVGVQSMNAGFAEGADLAAALGKILRDHGPLDLLQAYDRRHLTEWHQLLGLKGALRPTNTASSWAGANCSRILECLPASGAELTALVDQLGLDLQPAGAKI